MAHTDDAFSRDRSVTAAERESAKFSSNDFSHPFVRCLFDLRLERLPLDADAAPAAPPAPASDELGRSAAISVAEINPPPLPEVFLTLKRVVEDENSTVKDIARVIAMDPGLSSYLLRLANSALYSLQSKVESINRAVSLIGLREIHTMAMGSLLGRLFTKPPRPDLLSLPAFWRHSLAVAILARSMGERVARHELERYFVSGLLHDLGKMLLAVAEPDLTALALARASAPPSPLHAAEAVVLGFDHADLGGRVAAKWQLPASLIEAVACHHAPARCPGNPAAAAVHVADFMANAMGIGTAPLAALPVLDPEALALLRLTEADQPGLLAELDAQLDPLTALFSG